MRCFISQAALLVKVRGHGGGGGRFGRNEGCERHRCGEGKQFFHVVPLLWVECGISVPVPLDSIRNGWGREDEL